MTVIPFSYAAAAVGIEPPLRRRRPTMNKGLAVLVGAGMGAGLMYFYDPQMGRRRRALTRDQLISLGPVKI
jgi:hypothetical protein